MKTRSTTLFATMFALMISASAMADDHGIQMYVNPGNNPGFVQPRLEFHGHFHCGEGMHIDHVIYGGLAFRLGLEPGDMIVSINGQTILSQAHYFQLLQEAVLYNGGHADLLVRNVRGYPLYVNVHADFPGAVPPVLYNVQP